MAELQTNHGPYGFVNTNGKIIIPEDFKDLGFTGAEYKGDPKFAYYKVQGSKNDIYIDSNGNIKQNFQPPFQPTTNEYPKIDKDENGNKIQITFGPIFNSYFFYTPYGDKSHYGIIRKDGKIILPAIYPNDVYSRCIYIYDKNLIFCKKTANDLYGAVNGEGVQVIPPKFDDICSSYDAGEK